ncbi:MAG: hypothetical protein EA350_10440 [Gemmatimonadales bacterium]|nr:MAG: hypothetical protein EA350_10440 [Gemmatimonadales bacterium]
MILDRATPFTPTSGAERPGRVTAALFLGLLATFLVGPAEGSAQAGAAAASTADPAGWNAPFARQLLEQGRLARQVLVDDGSLQSYRALTEGHIYFFVDPEDGEQALIRVDQVAVELFWEAPDLVRQRVVGERAETRLPVRDFAYYLDRLTLVQYGFGDEIEVGQGMDVAGVPHPLAPPPDGDRDRDPYDVRLADSVTLRLPGEADPLRIHELQVRPRDPSRPGVLGSIFLNAADGQLVRMALTFTPASYVDPRTDRIGIELDYGLWEGRYWLPNRQEIEVRREVPELDFGVGTVIRAVLRVGEYDLNAPMPTVLRMAPPVTRAPEAARSAFEFREGLFDAMDRDGVGLVATRVDPRELRAEAARLLGNRPPTGLSPVRFHVPDISSVVRADRARGVTAGLGSSVRIGRAQRLRGWAGGSFATGRPAARLELDGLRGTDWDLRLQARVNEQADLGARPGASGLESTLGALSFGEDYLDPYRRSGAWVEAGRRVLDGYPGPGAGADGSGADPRGSAIGGSLGGAGGGGGPGVTRLTLRAGVERHRSENLAWAEAPWGLGGPRDAGGAGDRSFRPVRPVTEGSFASLGAGLAHRREGVGYGGWGGIPGALLTLRGGGEFLAGSAGVGLRVEGGADILRRPLDGRHEFRGSVLAGTRTGDLLPQHERALGGRGTVAGFPYRSQRGGTWITGTMEGARDLGSPWVRMRGGVDAGWAGDAFLAGARLGVGLVFDILRVEGARGLAGDGAEWQLLVGIDPLWWSRL